MELYEYNYTANGNLIINNIEHYTTTNNQSRIDDINDALENKASYSLNSNCQGTAFINMIDTNASVQCNPKNRYNNVCYKARRNLRCPKIADFPPGSFGFYCDGPEGIKSNNYCPPINSRADPKVTHIRQMRDVEAAKQNGILVEVPPKPPKPNVVYTTARDGAEGTYGLGQYIPSGGEMERSVKVMANNLASVYVNPWKWW